MPGYIRCWWSCHWILRWCQIWLLQLSFALRHFVVDSTQEWISSRTCDNHFSQQWVVSMHYTIPPCPLQVQHQLWVSDSFLHEMVCQGFISDCILIFGFPSDTIFDRSSGLVFWMILFLCCCESYLNSNSYLVFVGFHKYLFEKWLLFKMFIEWTAYDKPSKTKLRAL